MSTLVERGETGVVAQVRASLCDAVGHVICPPGRISAEELREIVGNGLFARLENSGIIRLEREGE